MRTCPTCGNEIKNRTLVNGKLINTQRRKHCYNCSPFGSGNNKQLKCEQISGPSTEKKVKKNKEQYRKYQKGLRQRRKRELVELFGGKCEDCGYCRCVKALEFHHLDKSTKKFDLSAVGYTCSWKRLIEEAKKCKLLCSNCHRETEASEEDWLNVQVA